MQSKNGKEDIRQNEQRKSGDTTSFSTRDVQRNTEAEGTAGGKDVDESYMDYNGNSEQNAPATDD